MEILVGNTGFVGSNLRMQHNFDFEFNSKNITEAYGLEPELCVYAGVPGVKFMANSNPKVDAHIISEAINNIVHIKARKLVLISTVDVFLQPTGCDENTQITLDGLHPYGTNRHHLEQWCMQNINDCYVLRLPALFGKNLRKNFVYDLIHEYPAYLSDSKYLEFLEKEKAISSFYEKHIGGFYKITQIDSISKKEELVKIFEQLNFSVLNFTDSRSKFQFYSLKHLWDHIQFVLNNEIPLLHLAVEPIVASELYRALYKKSFCNELVGAPLAYDFRTIHSNMFDNDHGYIFSKETVEAELIDFIIRSREMWAAI